MIHEEKIHVFGKAEVTKTMRSIPHSKKVSILPLPPGPRSDYAENFIGSLFPHQLHRYTKFR